jgi:hypothetical protein
MSDAPNPLEQPFDPPPGTPPPQQTPPTAAPAPTAPPPLQMPPAQQTPPPAHQQPYGAPYQQPYQAPYQAPPPAAPMDPMMMLYIMAFIGALLAMVGLVLMNVASTADSSDGRVNMDATGGAIEAAGMLIIAIGILMGLMRAKDMPDHVRLGLLIAFGLIVGFGL